MRDHYHRRHRHRRCRHDIVIGINSARSPSLSPRTASRSEPGGGVRLKTLSTNQFRSEKSAYTPATTGGGVRGVRARTVRTPWILESARDRDNSFKPPRAVLSDVLTMSLRWRDSMNIPTSGHISVVIPARREQCAQHTAALVK